MPRFVLLLHETPPGYPRPVHYDLMLEMGAALATWALAELPLAGGDSIAAERLPDHRLEYLDYEGEVSGGRGRVVRVDSGQCDALPPTLGGLCFQVSGEKLQGVLSLTPPVDSSGTWRLRLRRLAP